MKKAWNKKQDNVEGKNVNGEIAKTLNKDIIRRITIRPEKRKGRKCGEKEGRNHMLGMEGRMEECQC